MARPLPLLEAAAAVVLVGAVAILTALPSARPAAPEDAELHDALGVLRTAIFRFSMEHGASAREALLPGQDGADVAAQLTGVTRRDGSADAREAGRAGLLYGPYLERIPSNPVNGLATIRAMPAGYLEPVLTGSAGWVYVPETGEIQPDLPGQRPADLPGQKAGTPVE